MAQLQKLVASSRAAIRSIVTSNGATNPRLFGSVARGDDNSESDVNILIDAPPSFSAFDMIEIEERLEDLLRVKVDVMTFGFVHPDYHGEILSEAQII